MLFSSVDLPAPRKPDRMVTGSLLRLPAPTGRLTSSRQPLKHGKGLPKCHSSRTNTMYPSRSTSRHWSTQYMRYTAAVSVVQSVHCVDARHAASILTKLADLHDCAEHVQQRQRWSLAALLAAAQLGSAASRADLHRQGPAAGPARLQCWLPGSISVRLALMHGGGAPWARQASELSPAGQQTALPGAGPAGGSMLSGCCAAQAAGLVCRA